MDVWTAPEIPDHPNALPESIGDAKGPDFTTMDAQLVIAQEKKLTVTPIRLEGPRPLDGSWSVKEVGYDVVCQTTIRMAYRRQLGWRIFAFSRNRL